ncbi:GNAT family N-acetyltransferase [Methylobacter sp.]|uniref:GNAT family N-acetyltransferase n=1 Tax=Methylobacter sp. TaxID=2051955 RepID=UPI002FDD4802
MCLKVHDMDTRLDLAPWLAGLYVVTPSRRKGVGTALVSAIEKKSHELQIEKLYLYTPESEGFYSRLGRCVNEKTECHGYSVTIMEKKIVL